MDSSYQHQTSQITNKDVSYQLLKISTKIIISLSMFTFFLSNPSWLSLFLQSFFSRISSFPSQILSRINDKNCIFLLCNGILVIILKKSSSRNKNDNSDSLQMPPEFEAEEPREIPLLEKAELIERESKDEENELLAEKEGKNGSIVEDEAEQGSVTRMSTEELNRKFEEFIMRMKEEIRIEAHQQLVMV